MTKEDILNYNYQLKELSRGEKENKSFIVNGKKLRRPACFYYMVSHYKEIQKKTPC